MKSSADSSRSPGSGPIADRIALRLDRAGRAFDRRHGATRPKRRAAAAPPPVSLSASEAGDRRARACLRAVFLELGDAHRRYRTQTGQSGTPELRAAAIAFKRAPSTQSLLPVASLLDDLNILPW